ncbi:hypothetical protein DRB96_06985 [Streptomyces sp. ICC1]|nr:hypothetical protein DRB89_07190 [Streptomyces sp. ICC4]AWZ12106.1 hypothetical protein DRB96_06985 [Streptomyces sp. ICC1]
MKGYARQCGGGPTATIAAARWNSVTLRLSQEATRVLSMDGQPPILETECWGSRAARTRNATAAAVGASPAAVHAVTTVGIQSARMATGKGSRSRSRVATAKLMAWYAGSPFLGASRS